MRIELLDKLYVPEMPRKEAEMKKSVLCLVSVVSAAVLLATSCRKNHPPHVVSITANPTQVSANGSSTVSAIASDEDKDSLTYQWTANGGYLSARQGASVTWKAPDSTGIYTVLLVVADRSRSADTGTTQIAVTAKKASQPAEGQLLRDAQSVLSDATARLQMYGGRGPTNFRVEDVTRDPYETNLCTATVLYDFVGYTGVVALSYRWTGGFWECTGGRDLGMGR